MCTYARTVFICNHYIWGSCLKQCTRAKKHEAGKVSSPCKLRMPHGIKSRKVDNKCGTCRKMDESVTYVKEKLAECKKIVERMDEREKEREMKRKGKGVQGVSEEEEVSLETLDTILENVVLETASEEIIHIEAFEEYDEADHPEYKPVVPVDSEDVSGARAMESIPEESTPSETSEAVSWPDYVFVEGVSREELTAQINAESY